MALRLAFQVRRRGAQLERPIGPGRRLVFPFRRLRQQFELGHRRGAMAVAGADAVRACVAAADHHDMLALGVDRVGLAAGDLPVLRNQEFQRGIYAFQLAPRDRQIARRFRPRGKHDGVEFLADFFGRHVFDGVIGDAGGNVLAADDHLRTENDPFRFHLLDPALDQRLVELEVGNPVTQQAARTVVLFEDGHVVPGARELLRGRQSGRTGTDDGHLLAGPDLGRLGHDPAHLPTLVGDRVLDRLDPHRFVVDVERARFLAGRGTDAPGELGEIVGRMQHLQRLLPIATIDQVVPVGDDVVDRAGVVAERNAAIHAARSLHARLLVVERGDELAIMLQTSFGGLIRLRQTLTFQETSRLSHF